MSGGSGRPLVALDLATLHPGRGGSGGGIWSYARHLVQELDRLAPGDVDLVALAAPDLPLGELRHVRVERVRADTRSVAGRLRWVHLALPAWCRGRGVAVLHKLATEIPVARPGARVVATVHDFMNEHYLATGLDGANAGRRLRRRYFVAAGRHCLARADSVIAVSEAVAAEARRRLPAAAGRIVVVRQGVDAPPAIRPAGARRDGTRVLCVGMFAPHKGQHHAVRAFERLAAHAPEVAATATLTVRGFVEDRAYHATVVQAARRSPVADRIRFVGYAPAADAADIYGEADVLLFLSAHEGFGLPILEAQAAGVAVVCSDVPVLREVAGDGARFVRPDDPDAVAAALGQLLGDPTARGALVRRGEANRRRFGWDRTARETLEVYRALVRRA